LRRRLEEQLDADSTFAELLDEVVSRRLDPATAATRILERLDAAAAARPEG
jgi:LAO/AO transport system kinase